MAAWDYSIFWKETLQEIKKELEEQEFAMWFNIEYNSSKENEIIINVPSSFYRDQIQQRYQVLIESKLHDLIGKQISVVFTVKPRKKEEEKSKSIKETPLHKDSRSKEPSNSREKLKKSTHPTIRSDHTFDNYVIGENNSFAANAAIAISKNPGTAYNPFLIYGGVGLGKTHLMQAIGNLIYDETNLKVIYITAESFTNEFIQSIRERTTQAFKNKYRFADILLIDDIHFLQKKLETQEELFHTFNALYDNNKQMVFTCDRPVSELKNLSDRLRSRFERGLKVDLQPPNYETRVAIIKQKLIGKSILLPEDVIELIARNITTNVRDLESALNKIFAYSELVGKDVTFDIAQNILKDVFASTKQNTMSIEIIQKIVANYFSLSYNDIKGKKRTKNIAFPRQLAMYIAREITEYSTTELGQEFGGRDHTTVMHACQKIEERIRSDPTLDAVINSLTRSIKEYNSRV